MLPINRQPTHPGEILREEFRAPLGLTQEQLATALRVTFKTVNALENGRQAVTPEMALRLARCLQTTADVWLNLQHAFDLWQTEHGAKAAEIRSIRPLQTVSGR